MNLACVPEARVGDFVTVHVGLVLSIVDRVGAERVFQYPRGSGSYVIRFGSISVEFDTLDRDPRASSVRSRQACECPIR